MKKKTGLSLRLLGAAFAAVLVLGAAPYGHALPIIYTATLSGPAEDPANTSTATGSATVGFDQAAHTLSVMETFSGLTSVTTASHIHGPTTLPGIGTAGILTAVPTFPGFPLGVTSGTYSRTFSTTDTATYNPAFITANGGTAGSAEAVLASSLSSGTAYINIHTVNFPSGEIRGFLTPQATPEPATLLLFGLGLLGLTGLRKRDG